MKILITYLKPYRWLVIFTLVLAAVNMGFSLIDPIIFGKLINLANYHQVDPNHPLSWHDYLLGKISWTHKVGKTDKTDFLYGVIWLVIASISVAMISRIAKNFQDYFLQVVIQKFGATVLTVGLQHAMKSHYQQFEDQRSGETVAVLTQ